MILVNERKHKGLIQRKMAEMLNLPYSTYCEYEKEKNLSQQHCGTDCFYFAETGKCYFYACSVRGM